MNHQSLHSHRGSSSTGQHVYPTVDTASLYRLIDEKPALNAYVSPFDSVNQSIDQSIDPKHKYTITNHQTIEILRAMLEAAGINADEIDWNAQPQSPKSRPVTSKSTGRSNNQSNNPPCGLSRDAFRHVLRQYVDKLMLRLPTVMQRTEQKLSGAPLPPPEKFVPLPRKKPVIQSIAQLISPSVVQSVDVDKVDMTDLSNTTSALNSSRSNASTQSTKSDRSVNDDSETMKILVTDSNESTMSLHDSFAVQQSITPSSTQPINQSTNQSNNQPNEPQIPSYTSPALSQVQAEMAPFVSQSAVEQLADTLFVQLDANDDQMIDVIEFSGFLACVDRSIGLELRQACKRALVKPHIDKILAI